MYFIAQFFVRANNKFAENHVLLLETVICFEKKMKKITKKEKSAKICDGNAVVKVTTRQWKFYIVLGFELWPSTV